MKIFIGHSWNDKLQATQVNETLEKDGHEVWYDVHQLMPEAENKMEMLQSIMKDLEKGNTPLEKLNDWKQWCTVNELFQPELMKMLKKLIENDIQRLNNGGPPVSALSSESIERTIERLENAIGQKKEAAYHDLTGTIKKYGGFLMGEKTIKSIVTGYLNY